MTKLNKLIFSISAIFLSGVLAFGMIKLNVRAGENETEILIENDIPDDLIGYFESKDYEVTCITDENGNEEWYLQNNLDGTRIKISDINRIITQAGQRESEIDRLESAVKTLKTAGVIIFAAMAGALAWALVMWKREWDINNRWRKPSENSTKKKVATREKLYSKRNSVDVDNYSQSGAIKFIDENET